VREAAKDTEGTNGPEPDHLAGLARRITGRPVATLWRSWREAGSAIVWNVVGVDAALWAVQMARHTLLVSQTSDVALIQAVPSSALPRSWNNWAEVNKSAATMAAAQGATAGWIDALFDVHGHQVFELGCFNADCHPGNILVIEQGMGLPSNKLGLIDFGQCKHLTVKERASVAKLILSVADNDPDEAVADAFREMGIVTKNDSTEFLAGFARLIFGKFQPQHLDHSWHMNFHKKDKVVYFPKELSMVYRASLLLRGLAMSLQINCSVAEQWRGYARTVLEREKEKERQKVME